MTIPRLVLASQSRHRAALLEAAGLKFSQCPSRVDEEVVKTAMQEHGEPAEEIAAALARAKAADVSKNQPGAPNAPDAFVIGADQILVCEGEAFDKPCSRDEARRHLKALRGRPHTLETAVAIFRSGALLWETRTSPRLVMRDFSDEFLEHYLERGGDELLTCVGAYQIEGLGAQLFEAIEGDTFSIQGLPLFALLNYLRTQGLLAS